MLTGSFCYAQYIIAGDCITEHFVDINPDLFRQACSSYGCGGSHMDTLDHDSDGIADYYISTGGAGGIGGSVRGTSLYPLNGNLVLRGRIDSTTTCTGSFHIEQVAKVHVYRDTIKLSGDYISNGAHLNAFYSNGALCFGYGIYDFTNADQYAAIKFNSAGGVRLGWIKVYVVDLGTQIKVTIRSYAYTDSVFVSVSEHKGEEVSAKVFPNQFTEQALLVVDDDIKEVHDVALLDAFGRHCQVRYEMTQSGILLDRDNLPSGVYFLYFNTEKGRGRVKIVAR